jgi:hypothetical protein
MTHMLLCCFAALCWAWPVASISCVGDSETDWLDGRSFRRLYMLYTALLPHVGLNHKLVSVPLNT